jgi:hypothetical protein
MQVKRTLSKYVCDKCDAECTRSQLGGVVHWQDVKPMVRDESVSVTMHFCNPCSEKIRLKLGVKQNG